ncbi:uncharacterized protein LOC113294693 [Papaver somniferum]|uniref:uncharacterized protein LOC113294693 n=1 Tax=Papaver somniferum TaxID=3469 RepID=UPI000E6FDE3B|nr:uncharacterized protein LOC113294693 [Papaver somniferum]
MTNIWVLSFDVTLAGIGRVDSDIPIEIILTKAWFIWKERCNRVFEHKQQTKIQLGLEIQRFIDFWYKGNLPSRHFPKEKLKIQTWSLLNRSQFKLNIDAAWSSIDLPTGFSLILRNDAGDFEIGRAGSFTASTPEEAEAIGLLQGAYWAVEKGLSNFTVEGDCKNLFDYLNGKDSQISWQNRLIMNEVQEKFNQYQNFLGFYLVRRTANNVTDVLAKKAKSFKNFLNWRVVPPSCINQALPVDKSNVRGVFNNLTLDSSTICFVRDPNSLS